MCGLCTTPGKLARLSRQAVFPSSAATLWLLRDAARNTHLLGNAIVQSFGEFGERGGQILEAPGNLLNKESSICSQELNPADVFDTLLDGNNPFMKTSQRETTSPGHQREQTNLQMIPTSHKFSSA